MLEHSSFVRFPAIVVRGDAYQAVGPFAAEVGGATDFDMWTRLFARFGVFCIPVTTAAYVVHNEAHTTGVWTPQTLDNACAIFARAREMDLLDERTSAAARPIGSTSSSSGERFAGSGRETGRER